MMTPTKERPILMAGAMVRAVLAGTKTVTRRLVKLPDGVEFDGRCNPDGRGGWTAVRASTQSEPTGTRMIECHVGQLGDRLYVRETWAEMSPGRKMTRIAYRADMIAQNPTTRLTRDLVPWALDDSGHVGYSVDRWRPSIHMPRRAARLFLDVVSVRVEQLQDITEEDAMAEGIQRFDGKRNEVRFGSCDLSERDRCRDWNHLPRSPTAAFIALWDSLATESTRWCKNPWIWRVEFARANPPAVTA